MTSVVTQRGTGTTMTDRRTTLTALLLVAVLLAGGVVGIGFPAVADAAAPGPAASITWNSGASPVVPAAYPQDTTWSADTATGTASVIAGTVRDGFSISTTDTTRAFDGSLLADGGAGGTFSVAPAPGTTLHVGTYPAIDTSAGTPQALDVTLPTSHQFSGRIDVLDLAADAAGRITRLDLVFLASPTLPGAEFGEVRIGGSQPVVNVAQRFVQLPTTAVGGSPVLAAEWLRNSGTTPQRIGRIAPTTGAVRDIAVSADGCSGATLAPGALCTFVIGFRATAGGPRNATVSVPAGSSTQTVAVSGAGQLGKSSITTTWPADVDHPVTQTERSGADWQIATRRVAGGWEFWAAPTPYDGRSIPDIVDLAPRTEGRPMPIGTYPVQGFSDVRNPYYDLGTPGVALQRPGLGCAAYSGESFGTVTTRTFTLGADGLPSRADLDLAGRCSGTDVTTTAQVRYQVRSDVTAPAAVTALAVSGTGNRTVRWTRPSAADLAEVVVRIVPGTGAGATPATGYAVAFGTGTSAPLPALERGQRYTVLAWAVDTTGNTSAPARTAVTG